MIVVYTRHRGLKQVVEGHLSGMVQRTATSPSEFRRLLLTTEAQIAIVGTLECTAGLVRLLKTTLQLDKAAGPSCIVVTRVTFDNLRNLRGIEGHRLRVVWIEEIEESLPSVLDKVTGRREHLPPALTPLRIEEIREDQTLSGKTGPPGQLLRALGLWLLNERPLEPGLARAVSLVCRVDDDDGNGPVPPATSVAELAKRVNVDPRKLGYLWKTRIPLRCTLEQMIQWSVLLWTVRNREDGTWKDIARTVGVSPRTLKRYSQNLAGCTLTILEGRQAPEHRFTAWLSGVATE